MALGVAAAPAVVASALSPRHFSRALGGWPQAMGRVATPPPSVACGAAAADVCARAGMVGVVASQPGRDALCFQVTAALLLAIV